MKLHISREWLERALEGPQLEDCACPHCGAMAGACNNYPNCPAGAPQRRTTMFHWTDNIYFGRRTDGSVRVLKLANTPADFPRADDEATPAPAMLDVTIPAAEWASIVSSVSKTSETSESYQAALALHG